MKTAGAAAPARPDAETQVIHRQLRRRDNVEDADERLHAVEFAAHIFAKHAALEVGQNNLGLQGSASLRRFASAAKQPATQREEQDQTERDPVDGEKRE